MHDSQVKPQAAFVLGTGHCGSTLLSQLLRDHSRGLSLSEVFAVLGIPRCFSNEPLTGKEHWLRCAELSADIPALLATQRVPEMRWTGAPADLHTLHPLELTTLPNLSLDAPRTLQALRAAACDLGACDCGTFYTRLFDTLRSLTGKDYWIERSAGSLAYADAFVQRWPRAKYIHLHRDGVTCAASMARHPYFQLRLARLIMRDDRMPVDAALAFASTLAPARFGAYWSAIMTRGMAVLAGLPTHQVLHVSYEALVAWPHATLRCILRFLRDDTRLANTNLELVRAPSGLRGLAADGLRRACEPGERALRAALTHQGQPEAGRGATN